MGQNMGSEPGAQGPVLKVPSSPYVLVVDDDPSIRGLMADLLREEGYASAIARSGAEALARAVAAPPALILLDRSLPNESVGEVAAALRARAGWAGVPLMLFTGAAASEAAGLARELGAAEVVPKPFDLGELLVLIERYMRPPQPSPPPASAKPDQ